MKKKLLAFITAGLMLFTSACSANSASTGTDTTTDAAATDATAADATVAETTAGAETSASDVKVGFVYIGKINDEGYTQAHDQGRLALNEMGIATAYVEDVPETADCKQAVLSLIDQGCNVIYTTSFGFMEYTAELAKDYPDIKFGHCSGYMTDTNLSTYFGKIEQARYLSGIVAGLKTESNIIGYVVAKPIPECIRGVNAFTLGVQSVNPDAIVKVVFTNTWYDPAVEKQAALELLNAGADVMAQHQDSTATQIAAEENGAFAIGYNTSTPTAAPNAYLTAPLFHWEKFYVDDVQKVLDGTWTSRSYWEGLDAGMVSLDTLSALCAEGSQAKVDDAAAKIESGELNPFTGPIYDQNGELKVAEGVTMTDDEVWNMSWFVKGVDGTIPE